MTIDLDDQIRQLIAALKNLNKKDWDFAQSLIRDFYRYHYLSPKQRRRIPGLLTSTTGETSSSDREDKVVFLRHGNLGDFTHVISIFTQANKRLQWPRLAIQVGDHPILITVPSAKKQYAGLLLVAGPEVLRQTTTAQIRIDRPSRDLLGCISPTGDWSVTSLLNPDYEEVLLPILKALAAHPERWSSQIGRRPHH